MTIPLVILAVLSTLGGFLGLPEVFSEHHFFGAFLNSSLSTPASIMQSEASHNFEWTLILVSIITLAVIIYWAYKNYVSSKNIPAAQESEFKPAFRVLYNKYYIDELYNTIIVKPLYSISNFF